VISCPQRRSMSFWAYLGDENSLGITAQRLLAGMRNGAGLFYRTLVGDEPLSMSSS
jgi:hypothetical protein